MITIVMGVTGCGKTTVGRLLAARLGVPFHDADDFHSDANREKMRRGEALDDAERTPWLQALAGRFGEWEEGGGAVLACSALKRSYRRTLRAGGDVAATSEDDSAATTDARTRDDAAAPSRWGVQFIWLRGEKALIVRRMDARGGHFMPASLIDSQFATLEEPLDALAVGIEPEAEEIVKEIIAKLGN